jgi:tRNA nucleotidyltransferase/poly(A) polymerase
MRHAAPRLVQIAPERIRSELTAMLAVSPARRGLLWLQELNLVELLFGNAAKPGVSGVGLARLDQAEEWLEFLIQADKSGSLGKFFAQELEQGFSRAVAFKLAAWFSGQKFGDVRFILQKLHCSRAVQRVIDCLLHLEQRQADELLQLPPVARSRALWAEDLGSHPQLAACFLGLLLNVPFAKAARLLLPVLADLNCYRDKGKVPGLLTGGWLQTTLQLRGPAIGRCLAHLRQEEIAGRVTTRQQAEHFVLNHWQKPPEKMIDKET